MELTPQQQKKLTRMMKVLEEGGSSKDIEIMDALVELEERVETALETFNVKTRELDALIAEKDESDLEFATRLTKKLAKEMIDMEKGEKGDAYILTEADKAEIAQSITVPVVEKVIEKIETIREIPMVTENVEVREVAVLDPLQLPTYGVQFRDGLELLKEDERLDVSFIKGLEVREEKLSESVINRAIGIVDQRTSYLINKVSILSERVNEASTFVDKLIEITMSRDLTANDDGATLVYFGTGTVTLTIPPLLDLNFIVSIPNAGTVTIPGSNYS